MADSRSFSRTDTCCKISKRLCSFISCFASWELIWNVRSVFLAEIDFTSFSRSDMRFRKSRFCALVCPSSSWVSLTFSACNCSLPLSFSCSSVSWVTCFFSACSSFTEESFPTWTMFDCSDEILFSGSCTVRNWTSSPHASTFPVTSVFLAAIRYWPSSVTLLRECWISPVRMMASYSSSSILVDFAPNDSRKLRTSSCVEDICTFNAAISSCEAFLWSIALFSSCLILLAFVSSDSRKSNISFCIEDTRAFNVLIHSIFLSLSLRVTYISSLEALFWSIASFSRSLILLFFVSSDFRKSCISLRCASISFCEAFIWSVIVPAASVLSSSCSRAQLISFCNSSICSLSWSTSDNFNLRRVFCSSILFWEDLSWSLSTSISFIFAWSSFPFAILFIVNELLSSVWACKSNSIFLIFSLDMSLFFWEALMAASYCRSRWSKFSLSCSTIDSSLSFFSSSDLITSLSFRMLSRSHSFLISLSVINRSSTHSNLIFSFSSCNSRTLNSKYFVTTEGITGSIPIIPIISIPVALLLMFIWFPLWSKPLSRSAISKLVIRFCKSLFKSWRA